MPCATFVFYIWRMNAKWYISTLFLILVLFGFSQEQPHIQNQEIVVQFATDDVTVAETENAVAVVKKQLQNIGVANIKVRSFSDGSLKISYYSDMDVAGIKSIFAKENHLELGYTSYNQNDFPTQIPSENESSTYKLNVCEIQKSSDFTTDFNGCLLDIHLGKKEPFKPAVKYSIRNIELQANIEIDRTAFIRQKTIAIAIDNLSYVIPEVRAGPSLDGKA